MLDAFFCFSGPVTILMSYKVEKICMLPKAKLFNLGFSYNTYTQTFEICSGLFVVGFFGGVGCWGLFFPLLASLLLKLSAKVSPGSIFQNSSICWCHRLVQHTQDTLFPIYFEFQYKHICSFKTSSLLHACDFCLVGAKLLL